MADYIVFQSFGVLGVDLANSTALLLLSISQYGKDCSLARGSCAASSPGRCRPRGITRARPRPSTLPARFSTWRIRPGDMAKVATARRAGRRQAGDTQSKRHKGRSRDAGRPGPGGSAVTPNETLPNPT